MVKIANPILRFLVTNKQARINSVALVSLTLLLAILCLWLSLQFCVEANQVTEYSARYDR